MTRTTPLHDVHVDLGATMVDFAGWSMPVRYDSDLAEHHAVRQRAGLFDLSHMGEVWVSGPGAGAGLARALITDPPRLSPGRAQYSMICTEDGGIIDDLIVYRLAEDRFLVVPNAASRQAVVEALDQRVSAPEALVDDASLRTSLLAVQGPRALELLAPLADVDLSSLRYYAIAEGHVAGQPALVARTGYTGEDGFELFLDWTAALPVWRRLLDAGAEVGLEPCGLGARDTLRLEAGYPLYGNELSATISPLEASLDWVVKLDKGPFVGREALAREHQAGPPRRLVGFLVEGRGIPRAGYEITEPGGEQVGRVTSGTQSPVLGRGIGLGLVTNDPQYTEPGSQLGIRIRDRTLAAQVVKAPFFRLGE
jgi:aminomethyltransferase